MFLDRREIPSWPGNGRSKNGVASLAYARPSTPCLLHGAEGVDARDKRGHDENISVAIAS
jgi:hypothetical protein